MSGDDTRRGRPSALRGMQRASTDSAADCFVGQVFPVCGGCVAR